MRLGMPALDTVGNFLFGGTAGAGSVDFPAWASLPGGNAKHAWDFLLNSAYFNSLSVGDVSNTPNWTFSRASTGYAQTAAGVLVSFGSGVLRRTDKGVLIEGARTNLCLQSQTFDNASWTKGQVSVSADATTAPDGTTTADLLTEDSSTNVHRAVQSPTTTAAAYAASVYYKPNGRNWCYIRISDSGSVARNAYFNCSGAGSVGTTDAGITATITALANGWYRCTSVIGTATGGGNTLVVGLASADNTPIYAGNGSSGGYFWGAQLELGGFASSYIPTTTASATRAADSLTVTSAGVTAAKTLFGEFEPSTVVSGSYGAFGVSDGTAANGAAIYYATTTPTILNKTSSAADATVTPAGTVAVGVTQKLAGRFATNAVNGRLNAGALGTEDTTNAPASCSSIEFGTATINAAPLFGYLRKAAIWNRAVSDAELTTLTT